jgi:hypothetical protein
MKFGRNVSKDTWLKKKKQSSLISRKCNNACKKTLFSNMIILFWVFLVHRECNFMNVLILGSDHIKLNSKPVVVDINY